MSIIKYGFHVAIMVDGNIQFGAVSEIIRRERADGEKTEYVVACHTIEGDENKVTVTNEDDIVDLTDNWRKADGLFSLAQRSQTFKWAQERSAALMNPPEPPARESRREEGLDALRPDSDSSHPSPDEGANDVVAAPVAAAPLVEDPKKDIPF